MLILSSDTIKKIKQKYSIDSDDINVIRKELREKRVSMHPNYNFASDDEEEQYLELAGDIEKIVDEIVNSKALVCVENLPKSLDVIRENETRKELVKVNQQKRLDTQIDTCIASYRSKVFIPRVTLTTITAVLSFIWAFPSLLLDHPFFKPLFYTLNFSVNSYELNMNYYFFSVIWIYILFFTIYIWIITAVNENRKKDLFSKMQFESNQNELLNDFFEHGDFIDEKTFLKVNLINFLMNNSERVVLGEASSNKARQYYSKLTLIRFFSYFSVKKPIMDYEIADSVSEIILTKAINKGLIKVFGSSGLEDIYTTETHEP